MRREAERLAALRSEAGPTRTAGRSCTLAATPSSSPGPVVQISIPHTLNPSSAAVHSIARRLHIDPSWPGIWSMAGLAVRSCRSELELELLDFSE